MYKDRHLDSTNTPLMAIKAVSDQNKGRGKKCVTELAAWLLQLAVTNCSNWWVSQVLENAQKGVARECR